MRNQRSDCSVDKSDARTSLSIQLVMQACLTFTVMLSLLEGIFDISFEIITNTGRRRKNGTKERDREAMPQSSWKQLIWGLSDAAKMKNNRKPKCNLLISAMQPNVVFTDSPGFVIACQKTFPWARRMINVDKTREAETKYDSGSKKSNFDSDSNSEVL